MIDCIDTKSKTCIFGHGGIDIGVCNHTLIFKSIKPPQGPGTQIWNRDGSKLGKWEYTGSELRLTFDTYESIKTFSICLQEIEDGKYRVLNFYNITFDFTLYKQESMDLVKTAVENARLNFIRLIAC
jgi:hypothetical protein